MPQSHSSHTPDHPSTPGPPDPATAARPGLDPFAADLTDPYPLYARLRAMGTAVALPRYPGLWAVAGYDAAHAILRDAATFTSSRGVGVVPDMADQMGPGAVILHVGPPAHDVLRTTLLSQLGRNGLRRRHARINRVAASTVQDVVGAGEVDAVAVVRRLAVTVAAELTGLPDDEGRDALSGYSSAAFAAFGPPGPDRDAGMAGIGALVDYLTSIVRGGRLASDSAGADILAAAAAGRIDAPTVVQMLTALVTAGIDTTVHALANLLWLLGTHSYEWANLRAATVSVEDVVAESLRLLSPIKMFTRTVITDRYLESDPDTGQPRQDGVMLRAGDRVAVLYAAANRDPRRWAQPDRFWPGRHYRPHLSFGHGLHSCIGRALAGAELTALTRALLDTAEVVHVEADRAVRLRHAVLNGFTYLPIRLRPAIRALSA
jgi:cytochrome P450